MVKKFVLYDKLYNLASYKNKNDLVLRYEKYLYELTKGFSKTQVEIKKQREFDKRIEIYIDGPEENFVKNLLKKEIGGIVKFEDIKVDDILKGTMTEVGHVGFGIFLDCAIVKPIKDALLPLYILRNQLVNSKKVSVYKIIKNYDFINHFPLYIKVLEINKENESIKGEIAPKSLKLFERIINDKIEGLFISGATKQQFKKALIKKGHLRDIVSIERYGFLENIVLLKQNSNAVGIIAEIGKYLNNCKFSALIPDRITKFRSKNILN
ncbi:MAG: DUF2110 family protein [Candidatus Lokiarchaeota archaeon]|nr:DUF2110 family protein [Candidatus Lokiarchaeota archaeon]